MSLNDLCRQRLQGLDSQQLKRELQPCPQESRVLDFSSNDYLCLSQHPAIIDAGIASAKTFGAGATGSRLLSGNLACFEALEAELAHFKHAEAALVLSSGYQANSSVLAALLDKTLWGAAQVHVFSDRLNHASLHAGCQLAGIKQIRFRHNDIKHLAELLKQYSTPSIPNIIVTETVFGMEGDLLPIEPLATLALQHNALVFLDEAHATGIWGPEGRGLGSIINPTIQQLKAQGLWVVMGTFSKAIGTSGAYIACSAAVKSYLVSKCAGFVYSTAPSPFVIGAARKALELIPTLHEERSHLFNLAHQLRTSLAGIGLNTGASNTHIVPVVLGSAKQSLHLKNHLLASNIRCSAIRPPTVPTNTSRIRLALNVGHTSENIQQLIQAIAQSQPTDSNP